MTEAIPTVDGNQLNTKPRTILADVPFRFDNQVTRAAASNHYGLMSLEELKNFRFPRDEDRCLLLFWAWSSVLPECLEIVRAWGFRYKALVTWVKPHMGLGNYVRNATEHMILAIKGRVRPVGRRQLSWFIAEIREHSRKPEIQYDIAERLGEPPYLELFARRPRLTIFASEPPRTQDTLRERLKTKGLSDEVIDNVLEGLVLA